MYCFFVSFIGSPMLTLVLTFLGGFDQYTNSFHSEEHYVICIMLHCIISNVNIIMIGCQ